MSAEQQPKKDAQYFIEHLKLNKLPNDMYLAEVYDSQDKIQTPKGERKASSGAFCLYGSGVKVDFHTLEADEVLVLIYGYSLDVITLNEDGTIKTEVLGYDLVKGEKPQIVAPKRSLFAIVNQHTDPTAFSLLTAFTTPGFDIADTSFPTRATLTAKYPQHEELIKKYTSE